MLFESIYLGAVFPGIIWIQQQESYAKRSRFLMGLLLTLAVAMAHASVAASAAPPNYYALLKVCWLLCACRPPPPPTRLSLAPIRPCESTHSLSLSRSLALRPLPPLPLIRPTNARARDIFLSLSRLLILS